ncbi:LysR substrate-binding domain-containing protein [Paraburkholderia silviterrae]|uniref:LysR family transcriptional regulator n=1 Tax=Paraburkholderia silviterrae TaxID=2528715 RepID=A0A4R5M4L4_9BURK|nr:LysR substrate-binding domain-containing protein [Paraburkholderia silviterrae]TDG20333.1 LysR family transcriptional regulator [Paraburkholderia silviterrae]
MRRLPSLSALRSFEEASRTLSFTRAAQNLHVTQGAISRQIRLLEDYLGTPLFMRHHHRLEITAAGKRLLPTLQAAFDSIAHTLDTIRADPSNSLLTLNAAPTLATRWLTPRLRDFQARHPDLRISITNEYGALHGSERNEDCQIRFGMEPLPGGQSTLLMRERHVLVGSARDFDAPPADEDALRAILALHPWLYILDIDRRLLVWEAWLEAAKLDVEMAPRGEMEFSTLDQVIHAAVAGLGIAIADRHMIEQELANGTLVQLSAIEVDGPAGYWLDVRPEVQETLRVRNFSGWLVEHHAAGASEAKGHAALISPTP